MALFKRFYSRNWITWACLSQERTEDKKKVFQMAAARLQVPEAAGDKKPDQQESGIRSQETPIYTPSVQRNSIITSFQSPVHHGNTIRTITQSASRADLKGGSVAGPARRPAVTVLPKQWLEHIHNRPSPFLGGPSGACRSNSYHHMACNPPPHCSDSIHSDPLYRKTIHSVHPVEGARTTTSQSYGVRRGHATRYLIVNEHESRKKLLRSATRIPRHYFMEKPAEILELYPLNVRRYTPCTTYHQPHPYRSYSSQQHLSEEEGDEDHGKDRKRISLGKAHRPHSQSDLHQPAHFYIGDHVENCITIDKENHTAQRRYRAQEEDEEQDGVGEVGWGGAESQASIFLQTRCHIHSPGRQCSSPTEARHIESNMKSTMKLEAPQTESDSASLASSSDQQNSSTNQYIHVINNKERYLKSETKKKFKISFELKNTESNDLLCSNV